MATYKQQRAIEEELRGLLIVVGEDALGKLYEYQAFSITDGDREVATRVNLKVKPDISKREQPVDKGSVQYIRTEMFGPSFRKVSPDQTEVHRPSDETRPYSNAAHDQRYEQHARALAATRDDLFSEIAALRAEIVRTQEAQALTASEQKGIKKLLFAAVRFLHKLATGLGERVPDIIEAAVNPPAKKD